MAERNNDSLAPSNPTPASDAAQPCYLTHASTAMDVNDHREVSLAEDTIIPGNNSPLSTDPATLADTEKDAYIKQLKARIVELEQEVRRIKACAAAAPSANPADDTAAKGKGSTPNNNNNNMEEEEEDQEHDKSGLAVSHLPHGSSLKRNRIHRKAGRSHHSNKVSPSADGHDALVNLQQRRRRSSILTVSESIEQRRARRGSILAAAEEHHLVVDKDGPNGRLLVPDFLRGVTEKRACLVPDDASVSHRSSLSRIVTLSEKEASAFVDAIMSMNKEMLDSEEACAAVLQVYFPNDVQACK